MISITSAATLADCVAFPSDDPDTKFAVSLTDDEGYNYAEIRPDSEYIYVSRNKTDWVPACHICIGNTRISDPEKLRKLIDQAAARLLANLFGGEKKEERT
jgi:hypothetical protein